MSLIIRYGASIAGVLAFAGQQPNFNHVPRGKEIAVKFVGQEDRSDRNFRVFTFQPNGPFLGVGTKDNELYPRINGGLPGEDNFGGNYLCDGQDFHNEDRRCPLT